MAKLRRETHDTTPIQPQTRPLRIVASGTLFLTHTLSLPNYPTPSSAVRAHSVEKRRGGSTNALLSLLAQFRSVSAVLVAPLSGNEEGQMIIKDLDNEGVITRYCKIWKDFGVPSAWVLHSKDNNTRTVVNHNPLPDITHEEFVSILGPLLAPENYPQVSSPGTPTSPSSIPPSLQYTPTSPTPRASQSVPRPPPFLFNPSSPAPFDWLHFEGRSVKTTLNNITGIDGLAKERKWRSHYVIFVNKHYAKANSPHYATTPRAFLLSLTNIASPHALLVAHWGKEGSAVLSLPTKEYFQSSGWVEPIVSPSTTVGDNHRASTATEHLSVRSGSDFWAGARGHTPSSSAFFSAGYTSDGVGNESGISYSTTSTGQNITRSRRHGNDDDDNDSQGTEIPNDDSDHDGVIDEVGGQDAFVAGMIYALSRRIVPGLPYTPCWSGEDSNPGPSETERGRWRLDECLRFATELAGRKARRKNWDGLADEMTRAGWFDNI
ncbi:hypothetical protein H0H87_005450 [Tephrocybe sp. NHM501043]|nr:hypothetical protein H0H87_005450 [Tephrocybe sp. NHM501043]